MIAKLRLQGVTDMTPEEIVRLNALCCDVESPSEWLALSRGVPQFAGGATLWPMTVEAGEWYRNTGCRLIGLRMPNYALAYAMAHCYADDDPFGGGPVRAYARVARWKSKLKCRYAYLMAAASECLRQNEMSDEELPPLDDDDDDGKGGETYSAGKIIAHLSALTGIPPQEYERNMAGEYAILCFHRARMIQDRADGVPTKSQQRIDAERAKGLYMREILKKRGLYPNGKAMG